MYVAVHVLADVPYSAIIAIRWLPNKMNTALNSSRPRLVAILKRAVKKLVAAASNRLKLDVDVFLCCIELLQFAYNAFPCILGVLIAQL